MEDKLKQEWQKKVEESENDYGNRMYFGDGGLFEDEIADWWLSKLNDYKSTLQQQVEGMKKDKDKYSKRHYQQVLWTDIGYNQAIEDIIKIISDSK